MNANDSNHCLQIKLQITFVLCNYGNHCEFQCLNQCFSRSKRENTSRGRITIKLMFIINWLIYQIPPFDWLTIFSNQHKYERLVAQSDDCKVNSVPFDGYLPDKLTKTGKERLMPILRTCTDWHQLKYANSIDNIQFKSLCIYCSEHS